MNSDSLTASAYRALRAARVTGETRTGAVSGTSRRPTNNQAATTPRTIATVTTSPTSAGATTCAASSGSPNTGSSQPESGKTDTSRAPAATEPTARTIIGAVITDGDSCGCTPSSHRGRPKKVMSISLVM